jgi:deazaflavin-dependent oxidoreductase (nitroreductase family)
MSASIEPSTVARRRRQLFGLRRSPGRLAVAVFRMPLRAYHHNAGWLLDRIFLLLVHTGRKTGEPHSTVAMVLRYDPLTREAVICSAWGPHTDWIRNLRAGPAVRVQVGRDSYTPQHRFLAEDEGFAVAAQFRRDHPRRLRLLSAILGWGDLRNDQIAREFVRTHPFVALRPMPLSHSGAEEVSDAVGQRQTRCAADDHPRDGESNVATADPRAHGAGDSERE